MTINHDGPVQRQHISGYQLPEGNSKQKPLPSDPDGGLPRNI